MAKITNKWLDSPGVLSPIDETPSGTVNGVNTDFVLTSSPLGDSYLSVFINGLREENYTFTAATKTITFTTAPEIGSDIRAYYFA